MCNIFEYRYLKTAVFAILVGNVAVWAQPIDNSIGIGGNYSVSATTSTSPKSPDANGTLELVVCEIGIGKDSECQFRTLVLRDGRVEDHSSTSISSGDPVKGQVGAVCVLHFEDRKPCIDFAPLHLLKGVSWTRSSKPMKICGVSIVRTNVRKEKAMVGKDEESLAFFIECCPNEDASNVHEPFPEEWSFDGLTKYSKSQKDRTIFVGLVKRTK